MAYSGEARWRDSAGEEHAARLGEPLTAEQTARAWRTALNPAGEWMPAVIAAADTRLRGCANTSRRRRHDHRVRPDRRPRLRRPADRITGEAPTVVLSDDPGPRTASAEFAAGTSRWLVAVRMVSEGVDVPRLAVGVYATSASTPCCSPRPSADSCDRAGPVRRPASSCPRCPTCCCWPARWKPSATTCSASRTANAEDRSTNRSSSEPDERDRRGQRLRITWAPTPNWTRSSSTARRSVPRHPPAMTRKPTAHRAVRGATRRSPTAHARQARRDDAANCRGCSGRTAETGCARAETAAPPTSRRRAGRPSRTDRPARS